MHSQPQITLRSASGKTAKIGQLGAGLMNMTWVPEPISDEQAFEAIRTAVDGGSNMLNAGEFYGNKPNFEANLDMLARFYTKYPEYVDKTFLSVKGGIDLQAWAPDSSEGGLRRSVNNIIKHLDGKKRIDLYEPSRRDRSKSTEETMHVLKKMVDEGLFDYIGLSEVSAETIRRAHAVHPVSLVELEYSFITLDIERNGTLDTCAELGIPIAAYSPLGRGLLTGSLKSPSDIPEGDMRHHLDRFKPENFAVNIKLNAIAERLHVTPVQLGLAWLMQNKLAAILPIPGSRRPAGIKEALGAFEVKFDAATLEEIRAAIDSADIRGGRYAPSMEAMLDG